jgi:hypothetical protein
MENSVTVYVRTIGKKTWRKLTDFPTTKEDAEQMKSRIESRGKSEVKISNAKHGKAMNY